MRFCQLTQREVEYLALSRDTTESDLKQRREIRNGTAFYEDQCAVAAAVQVAWLPRGAQRQLGGHQVDVPGAGARARLVIR